jgi:hypothetical protein
MSEKQKYDGQMTFGQIQVLCGFLGAGPADATYFS